MCNYKSERQVLTDMFTLLWLRYAEEFLQGLHRKAHSVKTEFVLLFFKRYHMWEIFGGVKYW